MPQTGPRTPQSKARSSRNAARHGLYSRALVAGDETLGQWHVRTLRQLTILSPSAGETARRWMPSMGETQQRKKSDKTKCRFAYPARRRRRPPEQAPLPSPGRGRG